MASSIGENWPRWTPTSEPGLRGSTGKWALTSRQLPAFSPAAAPDGEEPYETSGGSRITFPCGVVEDGKHDPERAREV